MGGRFNGKRAIVTGSSKGIGLGVATRLAGEGASVVLNARTADELERAAKELEATGASVTTVAADLTDPTTPARLVDAAIGAFGGVDHVVSSIGYSPYIGPPTGIDHETFASMMVGNTWLFMGLVQAALADGAMGRGGAFVNISAIGTRKLFSPAATYSASKAALDTLTRELALDLGPQGIRVNAVAPGLTRTPTTEFLFADAAMEAKQTSAVPLGRLGHIDDIAGAVTFLLSDDASYITGVVLDVDGGALLSGVG